MTHIAPLSAEWFRARCGRPTASNAWRIMENKKNGEPIAERESYMVELITERLSGSVVYHPTTAAMQRGIDLEAEAIREYEAITGCLTEPGEWVQCGRWGCTPDAFVESDGLLEVKCPLPTTVVRQRFFESEIRPNYYWQCIAQLVATGRKWCDLLVYCPDFKEHNYRFWVRRINRSDIDGQVAEFEKEMAAFMRELDAHTNPAQRDEPAPAPQTREDTETPTSAPSSTWTPAQEHLLKIARMGTAGLREVWKAYEPSEKRAIGGEPFLKKMKAVAEAADLGRDTRTDAGGNLLHETSAG